MSTSISYAAALAEFDREVWAISPAALRSMRDSLVRGAGSDVASAAPFRPDQRTAGSSGKTIAVLPITGPISLHPTLWSQIFGGTVLSQWLEGFQSAVDNPAVSGIVLSVNSPGGSVSGVTEASAAIRAARSRKPIVAVANPMAASAAYSLASQASRLLTLGSGMVGSIGVYSLHLDHSRLLDKEGVTPTFIFRGARKVDGNPFQPLSDAAKSDEQRIVDRFYDLFVRDVAAGRGLPEGFVRETMADGRLHTSDVASRLRFVDGVVSGLGEAITQAATSTVGQLAVARRQFQLNECLDPGGHGRAATARRKRELAYLTAGR